MQGESFWQTRPSLIALLRDGDNQAAWREFVDRYAPMFWAWCKKWSVPAQDRADVVQDVFLKLIMAIKHYDPAKGRFRPWLKTVANHEWRDFADKRNHAVPSADSQTIDAVLSDRARDEWLELYGRSLRKELIAEAMCRVRLRVKPASWAAFWMVMHDGLSPAEACAKLGMTRGQLDMIMYRIRHMLAHEVQKLFGDE